MKSDDLLKAIGEVDEKYIKEADRYSDEAEHISNVTSLDENKKTAEANSKNTSNSDNATKKKRSMTRFSQVYLGLLSLAAAFVLVIIVVQALNIYKNNNATDSSMTVAYDTDTTDETASDEVASETASDDASMDDSSDLIENTLGSNDLSINTQGSAESSSENSASKNSESAGTVTTDEIEEELSSSESKTKVTTVAGENYTFSLNVPEGLSFYNTTGADSRSIEIDYLPKDKAAIILYPSDDKEDYLKNGNVVYIMYYKNGFTDETGSGNDEAYDYIIFNGENKGLIATDRSNWSEKYSLELEQVYRSLKLTTK